MLTVVGKAVDCADGTANRLVSGALGVWGCFALMGISMVFCSVPKLDVSSIFAGWALEPLFCNNEGGDGTSKVGVTG